MDKTTGKPLVSIIIPVFNDEKYIKQAVDSCLDQTLKNIEIICVDDKSSDRTPEIIEAIAKNDTRVKLIRHKTNMSALQARRTGIEVAQANYILFLDGDDEFRSDAAELTYNKAVSTDSDIVGFGLKILTKTGRMRGFENSIQPTQKELIGEDIIKNIFKPGKPAQGQVVRFMYHRSLLERAYDAIPVDASYHRAEDNLVSFQAVSYARRYTALQDKLYIYHIYRGESSISNIDLDRFTFYASAIDTINHLGKIVAEKMTESPSVADSYENTKLFTISTVLGRLVASVRPNDYHKAFEVVLSKITEQDIVLAIATFKPELLNIIRERLPASKNRPHRSSKNIALYTTDLSTGGLQAVVMAQARYLITAGFNVIIITRKDTSDTPTTPEGVKLFRHHGRTPHQSLNSLKSILNDNDIDTLVDHGVIYNNSWPFRNLIAKTLDIKTLAWSHNFSLRSTHDTNTLGDFMRQNINLIDKLVVLSRADVTFWKALGYQNVHYLPNPPSQIITDSTAPTERKQAPSKSINLIWYGRIHQATKKILSLLDIAQELSKLNQNFTFKIVGPDGPDMTVEKLRKEITKRRLDNFVEATGAMHGKQLVDEILKADILVNTSDIEGYLLTLMEAQYFALPVVMYELPWLETAKDNKGIIQAPQDRPDIAAQEIVRLANDRKLYESTSQASLDAAKDYLSYDFAQLYKQLLTNTLPKQFSPAQDNTLLGLFLDQTLKFTKNAAIEKEKVTAQHQKEVEKLTKIIEQSTLRSTELERELCAIKNSKKYKLLTKIANALKR